MHERCNAISCTTGARVEDGILSITRRPIVERASSVGSFARPRARKQPLLGSFAPNPEPRAGSLASFTHVRRHWTDSLASFARSPTMSPVVGFVRAPPTMSSVVGFVRALLAGPRVVGFVRAGRRLERGSLGSFARFSPEVGGSVASFAAFHPIPTWLACHSGRVGFVCRVHRPASQASGPFSPRPHSSPTNGNAKTHLQWSLPASSRWLSSNACSLGWNGAIHHGRARAPNVGTNLASTQ